MEVEFEVYPVDGGWEAVCKKYLVVLSGKTLEDLIDEIKRWVKTRFPGKNVRIILRTRMGEPKYELYVPGPAMPIRVDPDMFRV